MCGQGRGRCPRTGFRDEKLPAAPGEGGAEAGTRLGSGTGCCPGGWETRQCPLFPLPCVRGTVSGGCRQEERRGDRLTSTAGPAVEPACCRLVAGCFGDSSLKLRSRSACSVQKSLRPGGPEAPGTGREADLGSPGGKEHQPSSGTCSCPPPPAPLVGGRGLRSSDGHGMTTPCPAWLLTCHLYRCRWGRAHPEWLISASHSHGGLRG